MDFISSGNSYLALALYYPDSVLLTFESIFQNEELFFEKHTRKLKQKHLYNLMRATKTYSRSFGLDYIKIYRCVYYSGSVYWFSGCAEVTYPVIQSNINRECRVNLALSNTSEICSRWNCCEINTGVD